MKSRRRNITWLMLVFAALLATFVLLRLRNRVQALAVYPQPGEQISILGKVGVTFNQPMNSDSVEAHFAIQPSVEGGFAWDGATLWFIPHPKLNPGQIYQVTISEGAESENGRKLSAPFTWQATVREPALLYLVLDTTGGDLWRYEFTSNETFPVTDTNGSVTDFAPSPTGDIIVYAQNNFTGGSDLWLADRVGSDAEMLLDCGQDRCGEPTWSIDAAWIAYTRESFHPDEERYLPASVWTVNPASGETAPVYQQPQASGHSPSFSPDGQRLAFYDPVNKAIRILELESSQESAIPSLYPGVGDWSPDGKELIFIDLVAGILEPNVTMYIVNFETQEVRSALGDFIPNMDYDPPQWSPDGEWIAYAARPVDAGISKTIWVKNLNEGDPYMLTDEPSATFVGYRWDPWGERLVFQRYPISGPISHASIWLWERSTGEIRLLIVNGARPEWLP
jgi:Tol biopolymer transport system component